MASGASSSSSSFTYAWKYDVFLNFRGSDIRHGFIGNLYNALSQRGIHTFFDDKELKGGEEIAQALVKEIEQSRIAIPVFSKNYASSPFCLDELSTIIECVKAKGRLVLPVFYDVDPSDVRHLRGSYGEALANHEHRFKDDKEKVRKWRMALHQTANLSGQHFKLGNEYEYAFIKKIVKVVTNKINRKPLHVADYPVGLESHALKVNWLLGAGSNDGVHMVGIYGIGGIGKTTLARAVYNLIADQFEGLCFIENVREHTIRHGLVHLQETLLSEIFGEDIKLGSANRGILIIKHRLRGKKVLLILDVDKRNQLRAVVGGPDWFGSGSRVIITTREKHLLASHGVERKYVVDGLNEKEALELFCWNAFKNKQIDPNYVSTINRAVTYACGLPLALEVIGSNLFGKSIEEWGSALDQYERIPNKEIQKILKVSFDALEEGEQNVFLDIACCFKGFKLAEVRDILCAHHDGCQKFVIGVLIGKSLIKVNQYGEVTLHDLIQDMGKEIVRQEGKPCKRSRLWHHEDIVQILEDNAGTCEIQMIFLNLPESKEEVVEWDGEAFKDMISLRTLIIRNACFSQGPKHLPNSLRVLEWWGYPSQSLPSDFYPKKLVILKLGGSYLTSLDLPKLRKMFVKLRVLNFDYSKCITQIPDVSGIPNLEELSFRWCENLIKIDESVGFLNKLKILYAQGCNKLRNFPPIKLISLEQLELSYCINLESFPEILGKMEKITHLTLEYTAIKELPVSIQNLTQLGSLYLNECGMLQSPSSIAMLRKLEMLLFYGSPKQDKGEEKVSVMDSPDKRFYVSQCNMSEELFPTLLARFANVEELELSHQNFTVLPACVTEFHFLRKLKLDNCHYLLEIRRIPPNLETLSATHCRSLKDLDLTILPGTIKEYRFLRRLILDHCENLKEIRGVPSKIEFLSAANCTSLTYTCRNMLLNQESHKEAGNMELFLPGSRIPKWFEHRNNGFSISFWFRTMFPAISLCVVIGLLDDHRIPFYFCPKLKINGITVNKSLEVNKGYLSAPGLEADHIFIFNEKQIKFEDNVDEVLLENEWNHAEVSIDMYSTWGPMLLALETGLHVFKEKSSMEDILLTDPYENNDDSVNWDSYSKVSTQIISSTTMVKVRYVGVRKWAVRVRPPSNSGS